MADWYDLYTKFNEKDDNLEILFLGEFKGEVLKVSKVIPYKEIKNQ